MPRTFALGLLAGAAAVSVVALLSIAGTDELGWDFRNTYLRAAELVADGTSPYPELNDAELASGTAYVYPPQLAVALAPFTVLPADLVVLSAFVGAVASLMGAIALLGVRDPRCYAAVLAWAPTSNALEMTNISAFLVLALAGIWRLRDTEWPLATALGLVVPVKLFLWPVGVWALATRRFRSLTGATAIALVVTFGAWAVIGFDGMTQYPDLLRRFSAVQGEPNSYSILAASVSLGGGAMVGQALAFAVGGALLVASIQFGRSAGDDERSFIAALGAALALTPVAWLHYYAFLAVPLAIARPRFSALWLLPIVLWACPRSGNGDGLQTCLPVAVCLVLLVTLLVQPRAQSRAVAAV